MDVRFVVLFINSEKIRIAGDGDRPIEEGKEHNKGWHNFAI